jgi:hypothetical protein
VMGEDTAQAADALPEIVDVRPYVEIEQQMRALHAPPNSGIGDQ